MPRSEAYKKAQQKYDAENTKSYTLKLNRKTDAAMIEHLDKQPNRQGYLKGLIKKDMESPDKKN